jgi:hypothetical protein
MDQVICKELIVATLTRRGKGTVNSPVRIVTQVFEKDGTLVAENDPVDEKFTETDLVNFAKWCIENSISIHHVNAIEISTKWLETIKEGAHRF